MNKKILMSLFLVLLIAVSVSAVSAEEAADVIAVDDSVDVLANTTAPATADADGIQNAIASSTEGDTIDLSAFDTYNTGNKTITVDKQLTIKGNGNTEIKGEASDTDGIFHVSAKGVIFQGIKFVDTNPNSVLTYYDDATKNTYDVKGYGVYFMGGAASNGVVDNCSFYDFNHGVRIQGGAANVVVKNSYFTGVTNYLRNDPTVNVEKGTKAIGIMGSKGAQIINNTFDGPMLDAVSIASSSSGCQVVNNTFIGNSYAIYFGGAATPGSTIKGNKFKNVGHFEGVDAKSGNLTVWDKLPLISLEKSASDLTIVDNTFEVIENNILIAAEAGNAAHGYPSEIGGITVTGNTITAYDANVNVSSTVLLHVLSRGGELNPTDVIAVKDNTLNGAKPLVYWNVAWGDESGNVAVPAGDKAATYFKVTSITPTALTGVLIDLNGAGVHKTTSGGKNQPDIISGETFIYNMNGANTTAETDENGVFTIPNPTGVITLYFLGTNKLAETNLTVTYEAPVVEPVATAISVDALSVKAGDSGKLKVTLKDANGVLANKTVSIIIDGTPKTATTDANGVATLAVKYASAGTHYVVASYAGDDTTKSSVGTAKITVAKKATTLTAAKTSVSGKVKKAIKVTLTLKTGKTVVSGKKVTVKVNGKTFSGTTNSKGQVTITVKVAKKGTYKAAFKFAGDSAYKASSSKTVKFTVKK